MTAPKKLDFTSPARVGLCGDEEEDHTDVTPLTLKRSQRQASSKRPASEPPVEQQEEPKKKKKKKKKKSVSSSSSSDLIWNENDELTILKGLVEFRTYTGTGSQIDWDLFYDYIKGSLSIQVSQGKVFKKINKLKENFLGVVERINNGEDANFTTSTDPQAFKLSIKIWGSVEDEEGNVDTEPVNDNEAAQTNTGDEPRHDLVVPNENKSGEEDPHDDEPGDNNVGGQALTELIEKITANKDFGKKLTHDHEAGTSKCDGKVPQQTVVSKNIEDKALGEKTISHDNEARNVNAPIGELVQQIVVGEESHDDELYTLQDAFDTTTSQGLPDYQKKLQRTKLMTLETPIKKELSDEWKAICSVKTRFSVKMSRFSAKLVEAAYEAANDG